MPFESQVIAGAVEFTGLAGAGLFTFADLAFFPGEIYRPVVNSLIVSLAGNAAQIEIFRGLVGTPAAERQLLFDETGNSGGLNCRFVIPKDSTNAPMFLFVITTGKSAQGRAELDWDIGRIGAA